MTAAHLGHDRKAIHVGHHEIKQHERKLVATRSIQELERRHAAWRSHDRHPRTRYGCFKQPALYGIVIHDQYGLRHALVPSEVEWLLDNGKIGLKAQPCGFMQCLSAEAKDEQAKW
jgi:hypothetical protein